MQNFIKRYESNAQKKPQHEAVIFLKEGISPSHTLSYGDLNQNAKAIAAHLAKQPMTGERIILLYPAGLDFIKSLLACWYSGAIAVPVSCPSVEALAKQASSINALIEDAQASMILTCSSYLPAVKESLKTKLTVIASDQIPLKLAKQYQTITIKNKDIAFLQYTSGSTSAPKAAVISHASLAHCLDKTLKAWEYDKSSLTVNWAPHTHIYGLVCGLLTPLYQGSTAVIMPPADFIAKPILWLKAISQYRASHGGCPNFGYDHCVQHISEDEIKDLDLSHWKVAVNGGDMVQIQTLEAFVDKFKSCGFALKQFCSSYGMSELSGLIACTPVNQDPQIFTLGGQGKEPGRPCVSSGQLLDSNHALIIDPDSQSPLAEGETGEVWLSSQSLASGYWQRPEDNQLLFNQSLTESKQAFFRTGDLGFLYNNQLYLTGRLKEVMVIYGKKYYPLDFEKTIANRLQSQFNLKSAQVVFSSPIQGKEEIIVVQEIEASPAPELVAKITDSIKLAIREDFGVNVYQVALTTTAAIPRTNSGKLQRNKTKTLWQKQELPLIAQPASTASAPSKEPQLAAFKTLVGKVLKLEPDNLDLKAPLSRYDFDSLNIIQFTAFINEHYQLQLSPASLYEYSSLESFYQDLIVGQEALESVQATPKEEQESRDIAIIGMSGLFPGAGDLSTYWQNLITGRDCISEVPAARWDWRGLTLAHGGFIDGIDEFDARFFNISPREAALIDPQQRLFLQTVWHTLEDAGYTPSDLAKDKTALYVGVFNHDYAELVQQQGVMDAYLTTATMNSMIANRISYLLNLQGPSETIDTACSSSLVAIHHAVEALLHDDCRYAIAGGVNALITPTAYLSADQAGMLSPDGRCKTFDKEANGYVRAEGVGAVLLKKLSQAVADGDTIYGVIKGSAINHGGHANSLTAPNPKAQAELIVTACQRARIPVASLQYIEAHGTGTPLGDPIEINGLKKAFDQLAKAEQNPLLPKHYCGLGSVKTQIGHLESAAGIAGLIKLLLALKHEALPGNLHLKNLNPYIDLKDSPFYLVDKNTPWPKSSSPRRAGISSFGFGGTNAHLIIEEAAERLKTSKDYPQSSYLITLSAKTQEALESKIEALSDWLEAQNQSPDLAALSYTLNLGREHFNQRFALVVHSLTELKQRLKGRPVAKKSKRPADELERMAKAYLNGETPDWQSLYGSYQQRISLPGYPFARDKHWVSGKKQGINSLHPLLDQNQSGLKGLAFSKQFTGKEWFLQAHQIKGEAVLPGVVCLEMARVAAELLNTEQSLSAFSQVYWQKPIASEDWQQCLWLRFTPEAEGLAFTLSNQAMSRIYASGRAHYADKPITAAKLALDPAEIKKQLGKPQDKETIYQYFSQVGLSYEQEFQTLEAIYSDDNSLLAEIRLPELLSLEPTLALHPAMMDGILQSTQALLKNRALQYLPLSIREMKLYAPLPAHCNVYARLLSPAEEETMPEFEIQVADEDQQLLMTLSGFTLCATATEQRQSIQRLGYYQPVWQPKPFDADLITPKSRVILLDSNQPLIQALQAEFAQTGHECALLSEQDPQFDSKVLEADYLLLALTDSQEDPFTQEGIEQRLQESFYRVHQLLARLLRLKPKKPLTLLCLSPTASAFTTALAGLAKTLLQEQTSLACRIIEIAEPAYIVEELGQTEILVRYQGKPPQRSVAHYAPFQALAKPDPSSLLKKNGVYLITGGMGGLGYLFADYLAEHYQARLMLTGRSALNADHQIKLASLEQKGGKALYLPADVTDPEAVAGVIAACKASFGGLNGILHSAGLTQDSFIVNKKLSAMAEVLAPKIQGSLSLHEASLAEPLDFFVLFSSVAAVFGNMGQSDYAYANYFQDEWAHQRNLLRERGLCSGQTLSINWPLWQDGGLQIDADFQRLLEKNIGIVSLSTEEGMAALEFALENQASHLVVLPGHQDKLQKALIEKTLIKAPAQKSHQIEDQAFAAAVESYLKNLLAETLKIDSQALEPETAFEQYGIDSLMIIQLNQKLATVFKSLPKTLFFEYQNLAALCQYFLENHSQTLATLLNSEAKSPVQQASWFEAIKPANLVSRQASIHEDIAIIGLDGRYPEAENLAVFWENLKSGRDCIREIPRDRWDYRDYDDPSTSASGKSDSKWGGFISEVDCFDPLFFNISPAEASLMDPQERLFLQTAWKTIEDAGYAREQLAGKKVGVYVGVMYGQYQLFAKNSSDSQPFIAANSVFASIANRVSYFFDFHGPSLALDSMCSSSLTAIHLACQSLRQGEVELALAGGVNLSLHPNKYLLLSQGKFLSQDGHCHSFGAGGDGYVPGEGVGAVLLKPLSKALADGDLIYGVIKGSQLNHGGKTNGYTVPNPTAQAELIAETYAQSGVDPRQVSYIEAHGTGTALGDPIEIAGLNKAFAKGFTQGYCALGSVKANIGHCESAAGIAALSKVLLQIKHQTLVPSILSEPLNDNIDWTATPFRVQQNQAPWSSQGPRIAGISSFGAGGANAHLIVAELENPAIATPASKSHYLLTLSAKTESALQQRVIDLDRWLKQHPQICLELLSFTLNCGRSHFDHRLALVAGSIEEVRNSLQKEIRGEQQDTLLKGIKDKTASGLVKLNQDKPLATSLVDLAKAYVRGEKIDWQSLHAGESQQNISLPTYPFAKERYWYDDDLSVEPQAAPLPQTLPEDNSLAQAVSAYLRDQVQAILKMKQHRVEIDTSLDQYGMDSVHFVELSKRIAEHYQIEFTPAVFYTLNSIAAISDYLLQEHPQAVLKRHPKQSQTQSLLPAQAINTASRLRVKTAPLKTAAKDEIAIVGLHGLFPQSEDLQSFWQHLVNQEDLVTEVPADRWSWQDYYGLGTDKTLCKWGGFIQGVDRFDAEFFNLSAREANLMDPQQRLFLETVWKTIEDAGYDPLALSDKNIGVFVGAGFNDYQTLIAKQEADFHGLIATGNSHSMIANRISYFFNFHGPSEAIDTACSSSLVAIHRAVQAIQQGECQQALAGGVSLMINPDTVVITSQLGALSVDGRCKTFDKDANGYVKGEGLGCLLLKPLRQAQADGDTIYAVIKASAVNHGGRAKSLTAPNAKAQSELLIAAYQQSGLNPETIGYIETHGTGTPLGDPIEIEGLKLAFQNLLGNQAGKAHIALGAVKSNIGHLEPAAGIAGIIKLILAMRHETIPGIVHLKTLNPYINLSHSPFYIAEKTNSWTRITGAGGETLPLRGGVSSFGFGGSNAHLVLEEGRAYQSELPSQSAQPYYLLCLSAKQQDSLLQKARDLIQWLTQQPSELALAPLSYTLNLGRSHFDHRFAVVVKNLEEFSQSLEDFIDRQGSDYGFYNQGQAALQQGPALDLVYQLARSALAEARPAEQYRQNLLLLADLYCKHYPLDWMLIYAGQSLPRIASLPAYPFNKQSYWFDKALESLPQPKAQTLPASDNKADLTALTQNYLQTLFAERLQLPIEKLQPQLTYEHFGIDSVIGLDIISRLEKAFGTVPKTLLYEKNRIQDLAQYLIQERQEAVTRLLGGESSSEPTKSTIPVLADKQPLLRQAAPQGSQDIAIIGLNGKFPMADNLDEFWDNLVKGRDCITEVPAERWHYQDYPVEVSGQTKVFPYGGFINDYDKFDPLFFNISPRDAGLMDPQERLFMQSVWASLEDAGYNRDKLKNQCNNALGVFAGVTFNYYPLIIADEWQKGNRVPLDSQTFSIANRISYFLDFKGPSLVVDTACSSSLAAIHLACESLRNGQCAMAIAGGVNLSLHPSKYHFLGSFHFMSEQGQCASFAEGGSGYVPAEGVGSVVLKTLSEAIADGDQIYGIIKASSMNHGGKTSGYTVPNPNAQAELVARALEDAAIDARSLSYIEAHGTGTSLGDPIEIRGLQQAFERYSSDRQYCAIGSVKSNIGHLEAAAGISQLAKVLLQLRHRKLVPSLHAERLNPLIDFANSPFYLQRELSDWKTPANQPRRAGISSFGAGGANVHLIVEEYQAREKPQPLAIKPFILPLSALNEDRLAAQVKQLADYLSQTKASDETQWLNQLCYTLQTGREAMKARLVVLAESKEAMVKALRAYPELSEPNCWLNLDSQTTGGNNLKINHPAKPDDLAALARAWVAGESIDWYSLYQDSRPEIISLPTYPFEKRRCWIPTSVAAPAAEAKPEPQSANKALPTSQDWLYQTTWEQAPLPSQQLFNQEGKWLIISDLELGFHLQNSLPKDSCLYAFFADQFEAFDEAVYYLNPERAEDFNQLLTAIHQHYQHQIKGLIYLCPPLSPKLEPSLALLNTFKALLQQSWPHSLTFCLVTQSAQALTEKEAINLWQHHLWAMTGIFAAEQPGFEVCLLDLDQQQSPSHQAALISQELQHLNPQQRQVAYRGNQRFSQCFQALKPNQPRADFTIPKAALITGGLGALGYEVARYLVSKGCQALLLTGTSELSEQTLEKNQWLKNLSDQGAKVIYAAVDVCNQQAMQTLIKDCESQWQQRIDGVFHLAGLTTDNVTLAKMDESLWQSVLRVKVQGSLVLHDLFKTSELCSFVLFSSISAVPYFGIPGLSAYAAANEFLNGLAHYRRAQNLPAISINWVAWSEKGMSHRHNHDAFLTAVGMEPLNIQQGLAIFDEILKLNPAEITVCKIDWQKFLQANAENRQVDFFKAFAAQYAVDASPAAAVTYSAEEIEPLVQRCFADLLALKQEEINPELSFEHYGMDSILGLQFTTALDKKIPNILSAMDLYRYPSLGQLTDYLLRQTAKTAAPKIPIKTANPIKATESELDKLSRDQLNQLLETELKELELDYE